MIKKYYNPRRRVEPKVKHDWKKKYAEFCISQLPGVGVISNEDIEPNETNVFNYADQPS